MTQTEINRRSRVLAEFDQLSPRLYHIMHYHASYDWLMSVWVKFRDTNTDTLLHGLQHKNYCEEVAHSLAYFDILTAFKVLSDGVEWVNSIKQS